MEAPRSDLGDIGSRHSKNNDGRMQKKRQARRNAQACSRWFTIVLGGYRRLAAGSTPRLYLTRSAPLSGAADSIASRIPPGLGPWIEGPWRRDVRGTMAWDLISRVAWMQKPLGGLLEVSWGSFLASWGSPRAALGRSRAVLGRPWRRLGGLLELLKMIGRLRGCFQGLMEAKRSKCSACN